ncbi:TetR/AcrR family transcriptional regulator [Sphingobium tyrosinilyticum]|uniref:TetR/AcrR family transcriptional regulator n=1 Tax=Sphingobium tyrosinilyticum TaxID=2715436 RepID=A0ABV9F449_9SPHN
MLKTRPSTATKKKAGGRNGQKITPRNQAGRPTLAELERRKGTVLEVATDLFVTQGYAETSLVDIAKQAGVATRTLYQHFGDKEAIFREVIYARRSAPLIPSPSAPHEGSLFETLMLTAQKALDYVLLENSLDLMRLMVAESRRFPDLMARVATATFARFNGNVTKVFEDLAARRLIPDGDHAESAGFFLDILLGNMAMMNYTGWQRSRPDDTILTKKIDLFILGRYGPTVAKKARSKPSSQRSPALQDLAPKPRSSKGEASRTPKAAAPKTEAKPRSKQRLDEVNDEVSPMKRSSAKKVRMATN